MQESLKTNLIKHIPWLLGLDLRVISRWQLLRSSVQLWLTWQQYTNIRSSQLSNPWNYRHSWKCTSEINIWYSPWRIFSNLCNWLECRKKSVIFPNWKRSLDRQKTIHSCGDTSCTVIFTLTDYPKEVLNAAIITTYHLKNGLTIQKMYWMLLNGILPEVQDLMQKLRKEKREQWMFF